jgi:hypothetical protein
MTKISFYIIFFFASVLLPLTTVNAGTEERSIFLTQMLSLAEKPKPYFLINMDENKIQLLAKGIVLREWTAEKIKFTQGYLPLQFFTLEKKSIQLDQLRHAEPIEKSDDTANVTASNTGIILKSTYKPPPALDIEDMPSDYQAFLKGGASINVVTKAESYGSVFKRYLIAPIRALWPSSKKDNSAKIEIFFKDKTDSQTLFWAFTEGTECIIIPAGYGDKKDFQF